MMIIIMMLVMIRISSAGLLPWYILYDPDKLKNDGGDHGSDQYQNDVDAINNDNDWYDITDRIDTRLCCTNFRIITIMD
jgi:hypothetical protein